MSSRSPNSLLSTPYDETFDYLFKIVLIGDCGTGKTCVVQRFKTGQYEERHGNTIGVDFSMKTVNIDGKKIKVCLFLTKLRPFFLPSNSSIHLFLYCVFVGIIANCIHFLCTFCFVLDNTMGHS